MDDEAEALGRKYGPVLMRMVELLGELPSMQSGEAMERATAELGLDRPPLEVQFALLRLVLKITISGRLPGCPDA